MSAGLQELRTHHDGRLYTGAAVVSLAAAGLTAYYGAAMGGMPMAGGWTMSMMWMRMPEQSLAGAAAMFATTWVAMMVAMMLPSSLPMLVLYRRAMLFTGARHPIVRTWLLGTGCFVVWLGFGLAAYAIGAALSSWAMRREWVSRAVPVACGAAIAAISSRSISTRAFVARFAPESTTGLSAQHAAGR